MTFTSASTYIPHRWFAGAHLMTLAPALWSRPHLVRFASTAEKRLFRVSDDTQILAHCHWQKTNVHSCPTLLVIHGLEGSSESNYARGLAFKALACGMNAMRVNLRNCGGTMHLTPTLYNAGLSDDIVCVLRQLKQEGFGRVFICGYSLGGNIALKTAGELAASGSDLLAGVIAISPSLDLEVCVKAIEQPENRFYEKWFLRTLKDKIRKKAKLYPDVYDASLLKKVRTIRAFDDIYTAPTAGYGTAANYYEQASAIRVVKHIEVPTLIIASEDDPLVPFSSFVLPVMNNEHLRLNATKFGGHAGFIQHEHEDNPLFDHFWAENRAIAFCQEIIGPLSSTDLG
jgi:predicted alpha/beta-fold hydrolase